MHKCVGREFGHFNVFHSLFFILTSSSIYCYANGCNALIQAGLDMLTALSKSFGDAYKLVQPSTKAGAIQAPYAIRNDTGTLVSVKIDRQLEVQLSIVFHVCTTKGIVQHSVSCLYN